MTERNNFTVYIVLCALAGTAIAQTATIENLNVRLNRDEVQIQQNDTFAETGLTTLGDATENNSKAIEALGDTSENNLKMIEKLGAK